MVMVAVFRCRQGLYSFVGVRLARLVEKRFSSPFTQTSVAPQRSVTRSHQRDSHNYVDNKQCVTSGLTQRVWENQFRM